MMCCTSPLKYITFKASQPSNSFILLTFKNPTADPTLHALGRRITFIRLSWLCEPIYWPFQWRMEKDQMTHSMANGEGPDKTDAKRVCVIVQSGRSSSQNITEIWLILASFGMFLTGKPFSK